MATVTATTNRISPGFPANSQQERPEKKAAPRRTTVALSARAQEIVERFQGATELSMSEAVSELIERTEPRPPRIRYVDGFPTADVPMGGKWITTEDILRAENEPW